MTAKVPGSRAAEPTPKSRGRLVDVLFIGALGAWIAWAVAVPLLTGHPLADAGRYVAVSCVLGVSVLAGRVFGARVDLWDRRPIWPWSAMLFVLGLGVLAWPLYANAQAAVGVQLVALCGLMSVVRARQLRSRGPSSATATALTILVGVLGLVLALRAQAAQIVVCALLVAVLIALIAPVVLPRRVSVLLGASSIGGAIVTVLLLTSADVWPERLGASEGLSTTRHLLWRDAVELWRAHPILGGGPGEFLLSSPTAQSQPHLYAAHSSVLQVGAELGTPGVLLFLVLLFLGILLAARADRARALIGVAGWSALAVHSVIDHLYEYPVVVVLAGAVIGWAGALPARLDAHAAHNSRNAVDRRPRGTVTRPSD